MYRTPIGSAISGIDRVRWLCQQSFMGRASRFGVQSLVGPFRSAGGFDRVFEQKLEVREARDQGEQVECTLRVDEDLLNNFGRLHGGVIASLVDIVGTLALLSKDPHRPGVSIELSVSYTRAVSPGNTVRVVGKVLKYGKSLGFTQVDLFDDQDKLVASGRHTKAFKN